MSKRHFTCLKTTTGEQLEIGTRIRQQGAPTFGSEMIPIEGTITKMVECDSGIFLHVKGDDGAIKLAHVQAFIPYGVQMHNCGVVVTILRPAPRQMEIAA